MASFPLNSFISRGQALEYSEAYLAGLRAQAEVLVANDVPVILSLRDLAGQIGVAYQDLYQGVRREEDFYSTFSIRKRSGGWRRICVPVPFLLATQQWIHRNILLSKFSLAMVNTSSTAFAPDSSAKKNAKRHVGAKWLTKIDVKDFFESISERQVYRVFRAFGYRALVAFELTRLVTRIVPGKFASRYRHARWAIGSRSFRGCVSLHNKVGHLPQGAPSSPMLANLVVRQLDERLVALAQQHECVYSRYADDLCFTAAQFNRKRALQLVSEVHRALGAQGFRPNERKTVIAPPGARKLITGLVLADSDVRLPRRFKDKIRAHLYYGTKFGVQAHCATLGIRNVATYLRRLRGWIMYAQYVEPVFGAKSLKSLNEMVAGKPLLQKLMHQ